VALPLAWKLLAASNGDELKSLHGTRKAVRPATTKPVLGNTLDIIRNLATRHDWIASLCEQAKGEPVLLQSLGTPDMTLLSTPGAFEDVFKNQFDNFPKGPKKSEYLRELLGEGIFAVDNEKWYRQRKTASNLFTTRALRESMTSTIQRHLVVLERIFSRAAEAHDTLDMFRLLNRFTMEAFTEIGFGVHMNCLESDQEPDSVRPKPAVPGAALHPPELVLEDAALAGRRSGRPAATGYEGDQLDHLRHRDQDAPAASQGGCRPRR
jgi:hypothetical protein